MEKQNTCNVMVIWRGKSLNVNVNSNSTVKEFGLKLQELTNVRPDTMRIFVPQSNSKGSKMLSPFSDLHSKFSLQESAILEGKTIKMMGVFDDEIEEVSQNNKRPDLRIAGFAEEEERLRQRAAYKPQASLQLPGGNYIFCDFRTLEIQGIKLNPPPSEALRRMHMLACDPGIIAIMNKHRWRVGIMTEMAPEGYVGISSKCILGFNKNHGEEISLRLRTDDLKGFRKYESIKKTLLHELAHMVYLEHDSNFYALNKKLNDEAASLDWTKSTSHSLSGHKSSDHYDDDDYIEAIGQNTGYKLGGTVRSLASARASSVAAAYNRLANASISDHMPVTAAEPDPDDSDELKDNQGHIDAEPDPDDMLTMEIDHMRQLDTIIETKKESSMHNESDPDDSHRRDLPAPENEPDPDDTQDGVAVKSVMEDNSITQRDSEPDPDDCLNNGLALDEKMEELKPGENCGESNHEESGKEMISEAYARMLQSPESLLETENLTASDHVRGVDKQELQRIEEPAAVICSRLQRAIDILRSEATPLQATSALQTLFKIIRNVIEHPEEIKFRRLRKANPQFQRNVANYRAAMEVLTLVGFCEDVIADEIGKEEAFLVLKRNDPGLLWLAKSSLELSIA